MGGRVGGGIGGSGGGVGSGPGLGKGSGLGFGLVYPTLKLDRHQPLNRKLFKIAPPGAWPKHPN